MFEGLIVICLTIIAIVYIVNKNKCKHEWVIIETQSYRRTQQYANGYEQAYDLIKYHMKCNHCGNVKVEEL